MSRGGGERRPSTVGLYGGPDAVGRPLSNVKDIENFIKKQPSNDLFPETEPSYEKPQYSWAIVVQNKKLTEPLTRYENSLFHPSRLFFISLTLTSFH